MSALHEMFDNEPESNQEHDQNPPVPMEPEETLDDRIARVVRQVLTQEVRPAEVVAEPEVVSLSQQREGFFTLHDGLESLGLSAQDFDITENVLGYMLTKWCNRNNREFQRRGTYIDWTTGKTATKHAYNIEDIKDGLKIEALVSVRTALTSV